MNHPAGVTPSPDPAPAGGAAISIKGVGKEYTTDAGRVRALLPTDLEIKPREFVVLLGPSGCGKTTLLRMLGGLITPTEGSITIGDKTLFAEGDANPSQEALGSLGFVFQQATLMPWRKIWKNIALPLEVKRVKKKERRERAEALAESVGLSDFLEHYPRALSGGMQQRVAIARALIHRPSILLMDEPFGALDAMTRDQMNAMLQQLWMDTGKTVVLVTHSISEAVFLADRVVLLSQRPGRIQDIVDIDFERPRGLDISKDPRFGQIVQRLRAQLGEVS
ncbi:ABC transporter ATP-binding protein [Nonomuraea cavernae]|uniref:ABC transporter ATP-binding protein n=1 Tax=Nonomuraea cavernae TaxID=2045107 RepID=A0A917Z3Z4_9ACTN|nr:ABC transporter ATP-binding protein [Nonomuraea cavernae]MCA2187925.1 ABC transporter ATP-binding protein [Nonomuraea cavernae]GGO72265.1 ABC transporter ATP-binding protein [Nonomuraea cavernae]